ncbi:hypothetical protein GB937_010638, partial [Aspergillus fischeri]
VEEAAPEWPTTGWTVAEEPAVEEPAVEEPAVEEPAVEEPAVEVPAETRVADQLDESCFRIQVSAKHLILASSFFKKLLKGAWKESHLDALLILLCVVHGQYYHVPRKITLETLAKVAVLASYYDCREDLDILVDTWINALEEAIPKSYSRDVILWLWISWFFQLPAQFREATSTAMSCSNNRIDNLGLLIPNNVIRSMNDHRQRAIDGLCLLLHETHDKLLSGNQGSYTANTVECSAFAKACSTFSEFNLQIPCAESVIVQIARVVRSIIPLYHVSAPLPSLILWGTIWRVERHH